MERYAKRNGDICLLNRMAYTRKGGGTLGLDFDRDVYVVQRLFSMMDVWCGWEAGMGIGR